MKILGLLLILFVFWMVYLLITDRPKPTPAQQASVTTQATPAPQTPTAKQTEPTLPSSEDFNGAAVWAGLLTQTFRKKGSDVAVIDLDKHTIMFDCTKELNPRESCYVLYKAYPTDRYEAEMLKTMGINSLKFKTENGFFSGATWEKDIP